MVQLKLDALPTEEQGVLRLRMEGSNPGDFWAITANKAVEMVDAKDAPERAKSQKTFLMDQTAAKEQLDLVSKGEFVAILQLGGAAVPIVDDNDCTYKSDKTGKSPLDTLCLSRVPTIDLRRLGAGQSQP